MRFMGCSLGDLELAQPIGVKSRFVNTFFRMCSDPCRRCCDEGGDILFCGGGATKQIDASDASLDECGKFANSGVNR
jgi:hypothetical protein